MIFGKCQCEVHRMLYKWLNHRSQGRSMMWRTCSGRWKTQDMPAARVMES